MASPELVVCADLEAAASAARDRIREAAAVAIAARGRFSLCVDGGRPTQRLLALLAEGGLAWGKVDLWLGDERRVPVTDKLSNAGMIERELLMKLAERPAFRAPNGAAPDGDRAAKDFEDAWRRENPSGVDFLLLGMGPDGHTASLFPGSPALKEDRHFALHVPAPTTVEPKVDRLTLTPPAILQAKALLLFAIGAEKREALGRLLGNAGDEAQTPSRLIRRYPGTPVVIADQAAKG